MPLLSARLAALDLTRLGCDLPAVLREAEQEIARLSSVVLAVIAEMGRTGPYSHSEKDYVREEVAVLCRVGAWEAQRRLTTARELDERLPALRDALAEGRVTLPQVMATACELRAVDSDVVAAQLAEQLVVGLPEQTPRKARSAAERLIRQAVPEVVEEAEARQGVSHLEWLPSRAQGRWSLYADLNASEHEIVLRALDAYSGFTGPDDTRSLEERRADGLVEMAVLSLGRREPGGPPARASIEVVVPVTTLLGGTAPGELRDGSLVKPETVRRFLCDSTVTRLLVEPASGRLLDVGRASRTVPEALRRLVLARDRECQFPCCHRRGDRCDVHHIVPWSEGGSTDAANLQLLCSRHHHAVHEAGWSLRRDPDGASVWFTPLGVPFGGPEPGISRAV